MTMSDTNPQNSPHSILDILNPLTHIIGYWPRRVTGAVNPSDPAYRK